MVMCFNATNMFLEFDWVLVELSFYLDVSTDGNSIEIMVYNCSMMLLLRSHKIFMHSSHAKKELVPKLESHCIIKGPSSIVLSKDQWLKYVNCRYAEPFFKSIILCSIFSYFLIVSLL
ncbi:unnamed protein product, partial [Vitis vinifera]